MICHSQILIRSQTGDITIPLVTRVASMTKMIPVIIWTCQTARKPKTKHLERQPTMDLLAPHLKETTLSSIINPSNLGPRKDLRSRKRCQCRRFINIQSPGESVHVLWIMMHSRVTTSVTAQSSPIQISTFTRPSAPLAVGAASFFFLLQIGRPQFLSTNAELPHILPYLGGPTPLVFG